MNIYRGTAGELLRLAEDRKRRLDAAYDRYRSCSWWQFRKRRKIRARARELIAETERLLEWSAAADGEIL